MNYWPAETTNLAELHEPLLAFIGELAVNGAPTAQSSYGARGWVAHHNTDLWRADRAGRRLRQRRSGVGDVADGGAVAGAAPVEHYLFGGDVDYLREQAYPVMKGAAEFCLDWLVDDGKGTW